MPFVPHRSRKTALFWSLMGLSALSLLLPRQYGDGLKHTMQLLAPFQAPLHDAGQAAARRMRAWSETADAAQPDNGDGAQRQVVALLGQLETIRAENSALRGLRSRYVPPGAVLVPARVVTRDIAEWRDTLLLSRGASRRVQRGDPVSSRLYVSAGKIEGAAVGHLVLAREVLLGRIDQAGPFTARVRLFSDMGERTEVRVGRVEDGRFVAVDYPCTLLGEGRGGMCIPDVPLQFIGEPPAAAAGGMRVGDWVASPPGRPELPAPMVIGRVSGIEHDPRRRLVATVRIEGALSPDEVDDVYIVASGPPKR